MQRLQLRHNFRIYMHTRAICPSGMVDLLSKTDFRPNTRVKSSSSSLILTMVCIIILAIVLRQITLY